MIDKKEGNSTMDVTDNGMQRSIAEEVQDEKKRRYHDRQRKLTQDRNRVTDGLRPIVKKNKQARRYQYTEEYGIVDLKRVKRFCDYGCDEE